MIYHNRYDAMITYFLVLLGVSIWFMLMITGIDLVEERSHKRGKKNARR